jgi:hypothetical protein
VGCRRPDPRRGTEPPGHTARWSGTASPRSSTFEEEERDLFRRLRQICSDDELRDLGDKVRTAKKVAPTHPHPSAPDTPPGNFVAGPMAGLVDKVRDAFSGG